MEGQDTKPEYPISTSNTGIMLYYTLQPIMANPLSTIILMTIKIICTTVVMWAQSHGHIQGTKETGMKETYLELRITSECNWA